MLEKLHNLVGTTPIHPVLFYTGKISGYITWALLFLGIFGLHIFEKNTLDWTDYLSYIFLVFGLIFSVISIINLGESTRLGLPVDNTTLKTNGLYRFSRNPMYVGFDFLTIAAMLYTFNIWIVLLGLYSIFVYHLIILGEEKFLKKRFDRDYQEFQQRVNRYL